MAKATPLCYKHTSQGLVSSAISYFLDYRIAELTSQQETLMAYKEGLFESKTLVSNEDFQAELQAVVEAIALRTRDLRILSRQRRLVEQDMQEYLETDTHAKGSRGKEPALEFLEMVYTSSLVSCVVMETSLKKAKVACLKHDPGFRRSIISRYGASDQEIYLAWCHVTNLWWPKEHVKAAHLVPELLIDEGIAFLFGVKEVVLNDARNGLSLYKTVESALDSGKIAIMPMSSTMHHNQWKCVLVDQSIRDEIAYGVGRFNPTFIRWKELDNRHLTFITPNRPARRYLYFQLLITYLHAKMIGNTAFASTIDSFNEFWPLSGKYLDWSILRSLARNLSGLELPPSLVSHTFSDILVSDLGAEIIGMTLAVEVRRAITESSKRCERRDDEDENEDEDEDGDEE